jgi:hypothetical protein
MQIDRASGALGKAGTPRKGKPTRRGKVNSAEHRRKQSIAGRKYWKSPEGKLRKQNGWGIFNTTRVPVKHTIRFKKGKERVALRKELAAQRAARQKARMQAHSTLKGLMKQAKGATGATARKLKSAINKAQKALNSLKTKRGPGRTKLAAGVAATVSRGSGQTKRGSGKAA